MGKINKIRMPYGIQLIKNAEEAEKIYLNHCVGCEYHDSALSGYCKYKTECDTKMENMLDMYNIDHDKMREALYRTHGTLLNDEPNNKNNILKEEHDMFNLNFGNLFAKLGSGMCKLSMNGQIAVKTDSGYKTYNVKTGKLVNCTNFVFDMGDDMFYTVPAKNVVAGDIIITNGKPACVKSMNEEDGSVQVLCYENNEIKTVVPETNMFMPNLYFYAKVYSPFGKKFFGEGKNFVKELGKFAMLSSFFGGNGANPFGGNNNAMMLMMLSGNGGFGGINDMFDFDFDISDLGIETNEEADEEEKAPANPVAKKTTKAKKN